MKKIIKQLGYAPNTIARSLSRGHTNTLGVVGFGLEYFGPSSVLTGIEQKASEMGYSILLSLFDPFGGEYAENILMQLSAQQVAGIIWAVPAFTDAPELDQSVKEALDVPIVFLNRDRLQGSIVVSMNNYVGGQLATQHLYDQGYQKVGIITGPKSWWEANERMLGWRQVSEAQEQSNIESLIFEGNWEAESGVRGFEMLKAKNPDLDAIFVSNDQMSLGVIQAAHRMGIRIPEELGIVGFDGIRESGYFIPPLSTVRQDANRLGALAVTQLLQRVDALHKRDAGEGGEEKERSAVSETLVMPELVVRKSTLRIDK